MSSMYYHFLDMDQEWFTTKLESTVNIFLIDLFKFPIDHLRYNLEGQYNYNPYFDVQRLYFTLPTKLPYEVKHKIAIAAYMFHLDTNKHNIEFWKLVEYLSMHYLQNLEKNCDTFKERFKYREAQDFEKLWQRMPNDKISTNVQIALNDAVFSFYFAQMTTDLVSMEYDLSDENYNRRYKTRFQKFERNHWRCFMDIMDYDTYATSIEPVFNKPYVDVDAIINCMENTEISDS